MESNEKLFKLTAAASCDPTHPAPEPMDRSADV